MEIYFEMFFCFDLLYISFNEDKQIVGQLYGVGNLVSARFSGRPAQVDNIMRDVCVCVCAAAAACTLTASLHIGNV